MKILHSVILLSVHVFLLQKLPSLSAAQRSHPVHKDLDKKLSRKAQEQRKVANKELKFYEGLKTLNSEEVRICLYFISFVCILFQKDIQIM